ncbi:MAG TPA: TRAP transporter small permease subunit [Methyloprofundus sp.]|uniref:TRAP transporter small permease subunit n=1 Tax=Methyloprofundus sp. TaxID=2020875 RepID=UPI00183D90FF|nr:TRAP transporter small permease subunit [Methyloprofundus sp.]HIG64904.1 TRAP transporter small permease subunit [Methyloprofundus sp.]HIL79525.1 TRAP transporter small permease subunit [Methylococcales bacterium]
MSLLFSFFQRSAQLVDSLNESIGRCVSWLTLAMVLITFAIVVLRYLFDLSWVMMQESIIYLHALVFMFGAAYTLKQDGHVRVDIIYQRCTENVKAWIDLLGTLLLLLPVAGFILWSSWEYVMDSWDLMESSRNSGGLPFVYLLKSCLLLMSGLLILQGLSLLMSKVVFLFEPGKKHG